MDKKLIAREIRRLSPIGIPVDDQAVKQRLVELRAQCAEIGHTKGKHYDNGLGWSWWYCSVCGSAFEKTQT